MKQEFIPTHNAVWKLPKAQIKLLSQSGDPDYVALSKLNGIEVQIQIPVQHVIGTRRNLRVNFNKPFIGNINISCFKNITEIQTKQ